MLFLIHNLLQKSAELYPDSIAVRYKNEEISYGKLDLLSNKLSSLLISKGIKKNDRVAIYLDKSIDAVIAIFGVLKSGACYVPLDPFAPPERQLNIIKGCSINYLITSSQKDVQIKHILQYQICLDVIIFMDTVRAGYKRCYPEVSIVFKDEILEFKIAKSRSNITKEDLAYILYTSGSTGRPKGVMITHKASLAFINWAYKYFAITSDEKISAVSPFCFDLSIFDIFVTIKAGATICIVPSGICGFPRSLAEFIEREKISTWYSVPSILIQLVLYGGLQKRNLIALRRIIFAGEVFSIKYLRRLMQLVSHARYYNLYGPTETNVCTSYPVVNMPEPTDTLPIGRPCEGTEVFVVDERGSVVKNGELGELYVSGPTLMKGYWNDPQKSAKVLLNNFLPSNINRNVYRTGDVVKVSRDGDLEFHGRRDRIVKSRGYRIELSEVEAVLYEHPSIKEAAVVAIPNEEIGNKIKVAIVLKEKSSITEEDVKNFCSKRLPMYMIPEIVTFSNFIPMTSSGKVDRKKIEATET
jgi:amino acid adenylation domain-containing protein